MATKNTGIGDNFYVQGVNVSGTTNSLSKISGSVNPLDVTDITQAAFSRIAGLRDGEIDFTTVFDSDIGGIHDALAAIPSTDVIGSYFRGTAIGNPAASINAKQISYDTSRANDGMLTANIALMANAYGLEWGSQLTAGIRTDTSATAGSVFDNGAAFNFGAQAYLQLFSFSGTDVTVKIQHATTSGGSYADLITFTQVTSGTPQAQRVTVSNVTSVREFLKVTTVTTGGFTSAAFAVMINVNQTAGIVF